MPARLTLLSFALASLGLVAFGSTIQQEDVPLQGLVSRSSHVVVAKAATPASRDEEIDITPAGQAPDREKWPPFTRHHTRWIVTEVVSSPVITVGETIEVDGADWRGRLADHERFYVQQIHESPIIERYRRDSRSDDAPLRVLFLVGTPASGLAGTMQNGWETPDMLPKIRAMLANKGPQLLMGTDEPTLTPSVPLKRKSKSR